jgi:hypothetical protein
MEVDPHEAARRPRVVAKLTAFAAVEIGEEGESLGTELLEQTARAEGMPSGVAVASTKAFSSVTPASTPPRTIR